MRNMLKKLTLASVKFSAYLASSSSWPPNAVTVLILERTSSAISPAFAYESSSSLLNLDRFKNGMRPKLGLWF